MPAISKLRVQRYIFMVIKSTFIPSGRILRSVEFSEQQLTNIPHVLSAPRFGTYLQHCNNDRQLALKTYHWNLELSSAFLGILHVFEIVLRNATSDAITHIHGENWPRTAGFIRSLPSPSRGYNPQQNLRDVARREPTTGKIIAELKFVFWEKMFTHRNDNRIWNSQFRAVFPNAPTEGSVRTIRERAFSNIHTVRELRNRIAHHEPIFVRNLQAEYDMIIELIQWRDIHTLQWLQDFERVTDLLTQQP